MLKKLDQYIIKPFSVSIYFQRAVFHLMVNIVWIQLSQFGKRFEQLGNCKILVLSECKRCQNGITTTILLASIMTLRFRGTL